MFSSEIHRRALEAHQPALCGSVTETLMRRYKWIIYEGKKLLTVLKTRRSKIKG